jgi:IS5 family transposase
MALVTRLLRQTPKGPNKIYALHEPEVDCIFKGKARVRYEFGTKVSIATTLAGGFGRHELVRLATLIAWSWFEREWAGFFPASEGRPAIHPRLVAGLMYLQHAYVLSDYAVLARWVENPYFQHFTGETFFQHRAPIHPSSLSRWRGRIGEEGVEWLLTKTIEAAQAAGAVTPRSLAEIAVDTTVMEKAIAHPTDSRLYEKARRSLVTLAHKAGVRLRQNYNRKAPRLAAQAGRHAHARQFRRMRKALRTLKGYTERVLRDIGRKLGAVPEGGLRRRHALHAW